MNQIPRIVSTTLLALAAVFSVTPLFAQLPQKDGRGQAASTSDNAAPDLTIAEVEAELAAMEADSGIEDAVKELLRPKYKQAIQALKDAAENPAKAVVYREAIKTAPESASALRAELQALPSAQSAAQVTISGSAEDLQKDVDSRRAALDGLNDDLSKVSGELTRLKGRPGEISSRLPETQRELAEISAQLARPEFAEDATSPGRAADRILLQAQQLKLLSELEMLRQEQSSLSFREELLQAQQDLLGRQVENDTAAINALQAQVRQRLTTEARQIGSLAGEIWQDIPEDDQAAQALAAEVHALVKEFEDVVGRLNQVSAALDEVRAGRKNLIDEYDSISQELKSGSAGAAMAQLLFELQRQLAYGGDYSLKMSTPEPTPAETRIAAYQVERELRRQPDVESQFANRSSDAVAQIVAYRRDVLEELSTQYGNLIRETAVLESEQRQYQDKCREVRKWTHKQLVWMRSSPPISLATITDFPGGLGWVFSQKHATEVAGGLESMAAHMPVRSTVVLIVVVMLLLFRPAMVRVLNRSGLEVPRISTDRYAHTAKALFWTALLAIPVPLLLGFGGWSLGHLSQPTGWMRGIAIGLWIAAWIAYATAFLAALCRPGGLGDAHFRWPEEPLARLRRSLPLFAAVYIPALLVTCSTVYGEASRYLGNVGRISFVVAHLWTAYILWHMLNLSSGMLSTFVREHPNRVVVRSRYLWYPLVIMWPIALVMLAGLGYLITAIELSLGILSTAGLVAIGVILYWLALRWFMIKKRKLALAEALERRRARQEADASEGEPAESGEVVTVDPEDEEEMDLESIGEQTRHLLRFVFSLCVFVAIVLFWSETIPLIAVLDEISVPLTGGLTLLGLLQAVLVVVVTYIAVQNLPGLLEIVLRGGANEPGTRHAISTLCQYTVTAIGIVLLLGVLDVDWTKFGWIAAGLSVGLGFGLQEVVANLVCGLILLFESPIRMGDTITVEGTTGTVTRIRMRATTITNWDRQEFVVPNKNLITGTILNWTLTASINRIVIPVGVAYGTNTEKARQILLEVAADHPQVVDEPAPMATFDEFADSSLTLRLLAYIHGVENRRMTINELHAEIDKRFAAAGIEIAFPQRDLHLRNGWDDTRRERSGVAEDAKGEAAAGSSGQVR